MSYSKVRLIEVAGCRCAFYLYYFNALKKIVYQMTLS